MQPESAGGILAQPEGHSLQAGAGQIVVATVIAFFVGYAAIAWLLKFVSNHSMNWFAAYRVILGSVILILLATGVVAAY